MNILYMKILTIGGRTVLVPLFFMVCFAAYAQKLPNKQEASVRAPADIKIDGKATEWGNKFQAYNKATDIYYTISNDDENLYLVVQAKYHDIADKILRGGLTFTINHALMKKDDEQISVTYPVFMESGQSDVTNMLSRKEIEKRDAKDGEMVIDDMNKMLDSKSKTIRISGIKTISEQDISVYNQERIKAVSQFDKQLAYTYELVIPLKYLMLPNNGADGFSYNIKINEPNETPVPHGPGSPPPPPPMAMTATAPTDFWGEYTLAKK